MVDNGVLYISIIIHITKRPLTWNETHESIADINATVTVTDNE